MVDTKGKKSTRPVKNKTLGIDMSGHKDLLEQIENQDTGWRYERDKDEDYIHGRQRDSEAQAMLEQRGIKIQPIDNFVGKSVRDAVSILLENKKDAKIIANPSFNPDMVAAIGEKLSIAEDETHCDIKCFDAAYNQAGVGIEWVEVHRNSNLMEFPYQISAAPRNETFRDETVPLREWYNGQWMYQRKYIHWKKAAALWPSKAKQIKDLFKTGATFDWQPPEGGQGTGLISHLDDHEFWTQEERRWLDHDKGLINIGVAYIKDVKPGLVLVTAQGNFILDEKNKTHLKIAAQPGAKIVRAPVTVMTRNWFTGPLKLGSELVPSGKFPYVPFFYFIDGRTGHPYGISRVVMSLQDEHNARLANDIWNLGSMRIKMTNGAVDMPVEEFVSMVSRPDAVIPLNREHMNDGGIYEEKREYELSEEQYKRSVDLRQAMREAAGTEDVRKGFSGTPDNRDFEAPGHSLSILKMNFDHARLDVLGLLLDFILEDSLEQENLTIPAKVMAEERVVSLNEPMEDGTIRNDISTFKGKVRLNDIPSSPERTRQELTALSEIAKSVKHEGIQNKIAPWVVSLSGIPYKEELARELREVSKAPDEKQIQERIDEAVQAALTKAQIDVKTRELELKQQEVDIKEMIAGSKSEKDVAETALIEANKGLKKVETIYSAMQTGAAVAANAAIVPISQQALNSIGFEDEDLAPVINMNAGVPAPGPEPVAPQAAPPAPAPASAELNTVGPENTSPMFPPVVQDPARVNMPSIEDVGIEEAGPGPLVGIEEPGNQVE